MERNLTRNIRPDRDAYPLSEYERADGYQGLRKALAMSPQEVQELVSRSGLLKGGAMSETEDPVSSSKEES